MRFAISLAICTLLTLAVYVDALTTVPRAQIAARRIAARQATRSRVVGLQSEKRIIAAAKRNSLQARASVAPAPPFVGPEVSTRTYATYPGWDNSFNDLSADGAGPQIQNIPTFQLCIDTCNGWLAAHPSSTECTGISYDAPNQFCWVKGLDYTGYQYGLKEGTRSLMVGTCDFWSGSSSPNMVPAEMAAVCEQLNGQ